MGMSANLATASVGPLPPNASRPSSEAASSAPAQRDTRYSRHPLGCRRRSMEAPTGSVWGRTDENSPSTTTGQARVPNTPRRRAEPCRCDTCGIRVYRPSAPNGKPVLTQPPPTTRNTAQGFDSRRGGGPPERAERRTRRAHLQVPESDGIQRHVPRLGEAREVRRRQGVIQAESLRWRISEGDQQGPTNVKLARGVSTR